MRDNENRILKAGCVVIDSRGKVLLIQNAHKKYWGLPKGFLERNETLEQCAVRETLEETGWEVKVVKQLPSLKYDHHVSGDALKITFYLARPINQGGEPILPIKWVTQSKTKDYVSRLQANYLEEQVFSK